MEMRKLEKVIKGLECCKAIHIYLCSSCPYHDDDVDDNNCQESLCADALELLKEQDNEKKRIMKVIWDVLHEGLSIDTVADQDWVYEMIRHRIEDT